jgi:hypothetical protein
LCFAPGSLLKSENMKQRLADAKDRKSGIPLKEEAEKLGV